MEKETHLEFAEELTEILNKYRHHIRGFSYAFNVNDRRVALFMGERHILMPILEAQKEMYIKISEEYNTTPPS